MTFRKFSMPGTFGEKNTVETVAPPYAPTNISGCSRRGCAIRQVHAISSNSRLTPLDDNIVVFVTAIIFFVE